MLIKQMEAYYHYPEIKTSEMGVALNHREHRQQFEGIAKRLNEKYAVVPNPSPAELMRKGLMVFSSRTHSTPISRPSPSHK